MKLLKNRTVLGVLCIAVSLLICFAVTPLVNAGLSQKTTIVRFVKDVKAGEEIKKGMLQEVEVGGYNLPENVLRSITEAEGKYLTADVYAGDYIVAEKVADEPAAENKYLYNLNGEKQAISITISSFAEGLSGKLKSGGYRVGHRTGLPGQRRDSHPGRIKICGGHRSDGKVRL